MKIIENQKMYNTETASCLGTYCNGGQGFCYYAETLYSKQNGKYFLLCEGGANTSLAQPCGPNEWTGGVRSSSCQRNKPWNGQRNIWTQRIT